MATKANPGQIRRRCHECNYAAWRISVETGEATCEVCDMRSRANDAEKMEREWMARAKATATLLGVLDDALENVACEIDDKEGKTRLREDTWNTLYHLSLTITVEDARMVFDAKDAAKKWRRENPWWKF